MSTEYDERNFRILSGDIVYFRNRDAASDFYIRTNNNKEDIAYEVQMEKYNIDRKSNKW